jgi:hypothetical protein
VTVATINIMRQVTDTQIRHFTLRVRDESSIMLRRRLTDDASSAALNQIFDMCSKILTWPDEPEHAREKWRKFGQLQALAVQHLGYPSEILR